MFPTLPRNNLLVLIVVTTCMAINLNEVHVYSYTLSHTPMQDDAFEPGNKLKILDRTLTVCD